jgi:4'-phosphopantetheinyl transferase
VNSSIRLELNVIHVWSASLEIIKKDIPVFRRLLTPDEKERADRFCFEKDQANFITGRAILRTLLGRYTNQSPADVKFVYNSYGKPLLKKQVQSPLLNFNLSHSGGKVLYAFSRGVPLGIDLEKMKPNIDLVAIAQRFFSPGEVSSLFSLKKSDRAEAFYACWTRKEAFIKAMEMGLSLELDKFDVSLRPGEPARLISIKFQNQNTRNWSLYDLKVFPGFKACLAVRSRNIVISYYLWDSTC